MVDALAVTTVTGMLIAAVGMLIGNRLLPVTVPEGWPPRGDIEIYIFWATWVVAMAHAFLRSGPVAQARLNPAWIDQCLALAVLAPAAVLLNWITTGDHLVKTISEGYWPVAGMDLSLLVTAGLSFVAARHLRRKTQTESVAATNDIEDAEVQHG